MEKSSGLNLTRFFDQWFYSHGFPKISAKYNPQIEKGYVTLDFEQTQSDPFLAHFDLTLDVEIVDAQNQVYRASAPFDHRKAFVAIPLPEKTKVKLIRIDPDCKVLFSLEFNPGEEILEATAKEAKDVISRVRAYKELIKIGGYSALKRVSFLFIYFYREIFTQIYISL